LQNAGLLHETDSQRQNANVRPEVMRFDILLAIICEGICALKVSTFEGCAKVRVGCD
jgi:hypothetical protein